MLFSHTYKVYICHTDAGGIVYHANHLNFMEHCRRDWLTALGFDGYFFADGTHFVVHKANLTYKKALLLDDTLVVSIDGIIAKKASFTLIQHIYRSQADFENGTPATIGEITLACVKKVGDTLKPCPIPQALLNTHP